MSTPIVVSQKIISDEICSEFTLLYVFSIVLMIKLETGLDGNSCLHMVCTIAVTHERLHNPQSILNGLLANRELEPVQKLFVIDHPI